MTTEKATKMLGECLEFGGGLADHESYLWAAVAHARAADWGECGRMLARAYRALRARPPEIEPWRPIPDGSDAYRRAGYAFYRGDHPIQAAAVRAGRDLDAWLDGPATSRPRPTPGPANPPGNHEPGLHAQFLAAIEGARDPAASIEVLDLARNAMAWRADRLSRRRGHEAEVVALQAQYDEIVGRMLAKGWR